MFAFVLFVICISTVLLVQSKGTEKSAQTSNEIKPIVQELEFKNQNMRRNLGNQPKGPLSENDMKKVMQTQKCLCCSKKTGATCTTICRSGEKKSSKMTICCAPKANHVCCQPMDLSEEGIVKTEAEIFAKLEKKEKVVNHPLQNYKNALNAFYPETFKLYNLKTGEWAFQNYGNALNAFKPESFKLTNLKTGQPA